VILVVKLEPLKAHELVGIREWGMVLTFSLSRGRIEG
jgi:hypothetical protein